MQIELQAVEKSAEQRDNDIHSVDDLQNILWSAHPMHELHLGEALIESGLLTQQDLDTALKEQKQKPGTQLGEVLVQMKLVKRGDIYMAMARKLGIPHVSIKNHIPQTKAMALISADIALQYTVMPLAIINNKLIVAMENPLDIKTIELLQFRSGYQIETVIASHEELNHVLGTYYGRIGETEILDEIDEIDDANVKNLLHEMGRINPSSIEYEAGKKPIGRLLNTIILQGVLRSASDIHIRPGKDYGDILYRVDGMLQYSRRIKKSLLLPLIARLKIIGNMDIAERRMPQDGHARIIHQNNNVDFRISIIPSVKGESAVIRILNKEVGMLPLYELGFMDKDLEKINHLISHNHGMVLVTGPTGSGKSTTLYAALNEVKKRGPHIITVEDPVEYDMDDVVQIQVNNIIDYTFAEALRHILRHDPDVIMIGEIRDLETANIAVKAALTGHLVFSTLHTNDAPSSITRLTEMGIEPYLVSSTVLGVVAQRLVRKICPDCKEPDNSNTSEIQEILKVKKNDVFYHGKGCATCNFTGYHGRTTAIELLVITPEMIALINKGAPEDQLRKLAVEQGMQTLTENAIELARHGMTTLSEVFAIRLE
jgi:type IV pilus assembly protein PilB